MTRYAKTWQTKLKRKASTSSIYILVTTKNYWRADMQFCFKLDIQILFSGHLINWNDIPEALQFTRWTSMIGLCYESYISNEVRHNCSLLLNNFSTSTFQCNINLGVCLYLMISFVLFYHKQVLKRIEFLFAGSRCTVQFEWISWIWESYWPRICQGQHVDETIRTW